MSKIGKKPIILPDGVSVKFENAHVIVAGPKGTLSVPKLSNVEITVSGSDILLQPTNNEQQTRMNWGTLRSLIVNAVDGVARGFTKILEIEGVGFKASVEGGTLVLKVGFSHPVTFPIPQDISVVVEKNTITISGIDKQLVGQVAANIRSIKKPEPYLGKGIRYQGEIIRRKAGKKAGAVAK
ncbi:MAG: 50S ribosomal protein L6 [Candidatus Pacebacteria bacterium]|nr:50S ribosomal protein L6 [Candidatus Paceibacterota bacterium]